MSYPNASSKQMWGNWADVLVNLKMTQMIWIVMCLPGIICTIIDEHFLTVPSQTTVNIAML